VKCNRVIRIKNYAYELVIPFPMQCYDIVHFLRRNRCSIHDVHLKIGTWSNYRHHMYYVMRNESKNDTSPPQHARGLYTLTS
jgi:hypothetical protein